MTKHCTHRIVTHIAWQSPALTTSVRTVTNGKFLMGKGMMSSKPSLTMSTVCDHARDTKCHRSWGPIIIPSVHVMAVNRLRSLLSVTNYQE